MKQHPILLLLLTLTCFALQGQTASKLDSLNIEGKYQGKNLYAVNPKNIIGKDTFWTAQKVFVNNQLILSEDSLKKDAFEIPLTKLNLKTGDPVSVKIFQRSGNKVRIIQEMNCGPKKP